MCLLTYPAAFDKRDDVSRVMCQQDCEKICIQDNDVYQVPNTVKYSVCLIPNTVYRARVYSTVMIYNIPRTQNPDYLR